LEPIPRASKMRGILYYFLCSIYDGKEGNT
jgi:hypothetical protein